MYYILSFIAPIRSPLLTLANAEVGIKKPRHNNKVFDVLMF